MELWELFVLAVGLSMDAFAVSVCKGLSVGRVKPAHALTCGVWFGGFQGLMPLVGWLLGVQLQDLIVSVDHWIAFVLLAFIGSSMIRESREQEEEEIEHGGSIRYRELFTLAVATSIDALAVGVSFAFLGVRIAPAVTLIGCTTFVLTLAGVWVGNLFGSRYKSRAELTGGIILILIGVKILLEHLGVLG